MIGAAAAYMAGLFFASFFNKPVLLLITAAVIAAALAVGRSYGFKRSDRILMTVFFAAAVCVFRVYSCAVYGPAAAMDGCTGSFRGRVTEVRHYSGDNSMYILKGRINGKISAKVSFYTDSAYAEQGDELAVESGYFSKPSKDFLFDGESYYKAEGVFLSLSKAVGVSVIPSGKYSISRYIYAYRERIASDFRTALGKDSGDLLAGMVFGEKRGMDQNVKTAVYRCGIGHMLAVSGLHVSAAVFVLMSILRMCRVNRYASFALMEALLLFLTAMANYPVSAVRAAVMMNFLYAARLFRRQNDTFNSLAGAVLLICIFQPRSVYDTGFILSVAGTFGIGVFAPYMTKNMPKETVVQRLKANAAMMLCTTLCVFPFSLLFFDETSLISPVTNVLIVPLCAVSMIAGLIYALTGGIVDLLFISQALNGLVLRLSDSISRVRFTHFACGSKAVAGGLIVCAIMAVLLLAVFRNRRYLCGAIAASLVFLFISSAAVSIYRDSRTTVAVLGNGSNAALVITGRGAAEIIDLSGHYRSAAYVRKYLERNGISSVDTVILTSKVQSSYADYVRELGFTDVGQWLAAGDTPVDEGISCFGDGRLDLDQGGCTAELYGRTLTISSDKGNICFTDEVTDTGRNGSLTVKYGKSASSDGAGRQNIMLLSEGNNFEIVLSGDGRFDIRRL